VIGSDPLVRVQLERLAPLPDGAGADWDDVVRRSSSRHARSWASPRRLALAVAAIAVIGLIAGLAVAATGWLDGAPAPPDVVHDFNQYTPQLGFHPESSRAVAVAHDGNAFTLYATTNKEGGYCVALSAPWKRPSSNPDGGTCVGNEVLSAPIAAGILGASQSSFVVAGRVDRAAARTIEFEAPDGTPVESAVGSSGFFVAAVLVHDPLTVCAHGDWAPVFFARDHHGKEVVSAKITLGSHVSGVGVGCTIGVSPHS
jgi:hypothetical protein